MSIMLFNPTNEKFEMQYAGLTVFMEPEEKKKVSDACGKHLLNSFGPRGLTSLEYGCDEEKIAKDAVARNFEFKKKQVMEYNQRNEARKQQKMSFLSPTETVKRYSLELGIELDELYTLKDEEKSEMRRLAIENVELKKQMTMLLKKVESLLIKKGG